MASPSPVDDDTVLNALPPDAPEGHEAHAAVEFENQKWPRALFFVGTGKEKVRFQATIGNAGTEAAAMRVARACYVKLSQGATLDEVKQFRQECYNDVKRARRRLPQGETVGSKEEGSASG